MPIHARLDSYVVEVMSPYRSDTRIGIDVRALLQNQSVLSDPVHLNVATDVYYAHYRAAHPSLG